METETSGFISRPAVLELRQSLCLLISSCHQNIARNSNLHGGTKLVLSLVNFNVLQTFGDHMTVSIGELMSGLCISRMQIHLEEHGKHATVEFVIPYCLFSDRPRVVMEVYCLKLLGYESRRHQKHKSMAAFSVPLTAHSVFLLLDSSRVRVQIGQAPDYCWIMW